jgi:3-hydroxyisobutyrate dehydrogenase
MDKKIVAVLGSGIMGSGIGRALISAGYEVRTWDGIPEKAKALESEGFIAYDSLEETIKGADYIYTVLFAADDIKWAFENALPFTNENTVWIQCATIGAEGSKVINDFVNEHNLIAVEANMMGSKDQANSGDLVFIVGGKKDSYEKAKTVLEAGAKQIVYCGEKIGDGTAVKLACNSWISFLTAGAAQSVALLKAQNVDPKLWLEVIDNATSASPYANIKGGKMIDDDFAVQFSVDALNKDLKLAHTAAENAGVDTRAMDSMFALYDETSKNGFGNDDISAVYNVIRKDKK